MQPDVTPFHHVTVLRDEAVAILSPRSGGHWVDLTMGGGGHTERLLEATAPDGRVLALDRDPVAIDAASRRLARFGDRLQVVRSTFSRLDDVLDEQSFGRVEGETRRVDGILLDAGVSSPQLDTAERGFSFQAAGPLDMRMSGEGRTAFDLLDRIGVDELAELLRTLGEVPMAGRTARAILRARDEGRLQTTRDLAEVCRVAVGSAARDRIHPATLVFQALRIAVNDELGELRRVLEVAPLHLAIGGVFAVISFHSLEDRLVKHAFRALARPPEVPRHLPVRHVDAPCAFEEIGGLIRPSDAESNANPRARSARMRAIRRVRESSP